MLTMFFWLVLIALVFYAGWLHRRVKLLEQRNGLPTPHFAAEQEAKLQELVRDAVRKYATKA